MKVRRAAVSLASIALLAAACQSPTKPATLTLSALALNTASIVGGTATKAVVTLGAAAPRGGITVALASGSSLATVPQSVLIPAGASSATVDVTTVAVAAQT